MGAPFSSMLSRLYQARRRVREEWFPLAIPAAAYRTRRLALATISSTCASCRSHLSFLYLAGSMTC